MFYLRPINQGLKHLINLYTKIILLFSEICHSLTQKYARIRLNFKHDKTIKQQDVNHKVLSDRVLLLRKLMKC